MVTRYGAELAGLPLICGLMPSYLEHLRLELAFFGKAHHQLGDAGW